MFSNHYPYTDFHRLNLDWVLEVVAKAEDIIVHARADIDKNKADIAENLRKITDLEALTGSHTAEIAAIKAKIATAEGKIQANENEIKKIQENITAIESNFFVLNNTVNYHSTEIAALKNTVDTVVNTDIPNIEADIAVHTSDIADNKLQAGLANSRLETLFDYYLMYTFRLNVPAEKWLPLGLPGAPFGHVYSLPVDVAIKMKEIYTNIFCSATGVTGYLAAAKAQCRLDHVQYGANQNDVKLVFYAEKQPTEEVHFNIGITFNNPRIDFRK